MARRFALPLVFLWSLILAALVLPLAARAQDAATITALLQALPSQYVAPAFGLWLFLFYVVGPILKRQADGRAARIGEYLTQDTRRPPTSPPSSSSTIAKLGGAALLLALAGPAVAQDAPPAAIGTVQTRALGLVSFGPSAAVTLGALELRSGVYSQGWKLAPGLGVAAWADRWYTVGLSAALLYQPGGDDTAARAAASLSFAKYLRVMYGYGGRVLVGVGVGP